MKKRKIFIIGDSHTAAIKKALQDFKSTEFEIDVHWLYSNKNGTEKGNLPLDVAIEKVKNLAEDDFLVISILGTYHNIFGLLQHQLKFDVMTKNNNDINQCTIIIPYRTVEAEFDARCLKNKNISLMAQNTVAKTILLMTPPPKEDNIFIESKIKNLQGKLFLGIGINDSKLRLSLYEIEKESVRKFCGKNGMEFVGAPDSCINNRGYLLKEYWADDAQHANKAYGMKLLEQLEFLL